MYETVKTVNGYDIVRMKGTHGAYHINIREGKTWQEFHTFKTQKAAAAFAASLPPKVNREINSMCLSCKRYRNGCNGEVSTVYTGCVMKEI